MSDTETTRRATPTDAEGKYLTFNLDAEDYGIPILQVQEIIGVQRITPLPHAPDHVLGVINLRGKVVPVVDLRRKFGLEPTEPDAQTCIIVVEAARRRTGFVVDGVDEVVGIAADSVEPAPDLGPGVRTDFIRGMGKTDDAVKILLDVDRLLGAENDVPAADSA